MKKKRKESSLKEEKNLYVYQPKIDISGENTFLKIISNKGTIAYDKNIVKLENKTEISGKVNEKDILGKASKVDIDLNKRNLSSDELIIFIDEYEISVKEIILNEDEIVFGPQVRAIYYVLQKDTDSTGNIDASEYDITLINPGMTEDFEDYSVT